MAAPIDEINKRNSSPVHVFLASADINSNVHGPAHTVTTRNFTLNINRALKRKLQRCEQVNIDYEVKVGG